MSDFIAQGQPFETPVGAAMDEYAKTPPSFSKAVGAFFGESSTVAETGRGIERSQYTSMTDRQEGEAQGRMAAADPNLMPGQPPQDDYFAGLKSGPAIPTPTLSAEDANKKYAPMGPDGKQTKITDQPIPEGVAQLVGKAKSDEIERQSIISRYSDAHSLPVTFGTGLVGFMMDPLNTASLFLPGLGEETVLGGLGRVGMATSSIAAKTVSRATAGAVTGGIAQAPLSLARWGMGTEEASDYSLRDAFKDMAFAAAGGAVLHAGFGAVGDALRARRVMPADIAPEATTAPPNAMAGDAASILHADAPTKMDAMRSAVAQVADGREVDVDPIFKHEPVSDVATEQRSVYQDGYAPGVPPDEMRATQEAMYGKGEPAPPTPETPGAAATPLDHDLAAAEAQLTGMQKEGAAIHPEDQAEIERTAKGMAQADSKTQALQQAAQCLAVAAE